MSPRWCDGRLRLLPLVALIHHAALVEAERPTQDFHGGERKSDRKGLISFESAVAHSIGWSSISNTTDKDSNLATKTQKKGKGPKGNTSPQQSMYSKLVGRKSVKKQLVHTLEFAANVAVGLRVDEATGNVLEVFHGGQAEFQGVQTGWRIDQIETSRGSKRYKASRWEKCKDGQEPGRPWGTKKRTKPYTIKFVKVDSPFGFETEDTVSYIISKRNHLCVGKFDTALKVVEKNNAAEAVQKCAEAVSENGKCSETFHYSRRSSDGKSDCVCVMKGQVCKKAQDVEGTTSNVYEVRDKDFGRGKGNTDFLRMDEFGDHLETNIHTMKESMDNEDGPLRMAADEAIRNHNEYVHTLWKNHDLSDSLEASVDEMIEGLSHEDKFGMHQMKQQTDLGHEEVELYPMIFKHAWETANKRLPRLDKENQESEAALEKLLIQDDKQMSTEISNEVAAMSELKKPLDPYYKWGVAEPKAKGAAWKGAGRKLGKVGSLGK